MQLVMFCSVKAEGEGGREEERERERGRMASYLQVPFVLICGHFGICVVKCIQTSPLYF